MASPIRTKPTTPRPPTGASRLMAGGMGAAAGGVKRPSIKPPAPKRSPSPGPPPKMNTFKKPAGQKTPGVIDHPAKYRAAHPNANLRTYKNAEGKTVAKVVRSSGVKRAVRKNPPPVGKAPRQPRPIGY